MAKKKSMNPVAAGLVGAAVGAAVGVAAAELSVKENREKVEEKLGEIKDEAEKVLTGIKKED